MVRLLCIFSFPYKVEEKGTAGGGGGGRQVWKGGQEKQVPGHSKARGGHDTRTPPGAGEGVTCRPGNLGPEQKREIPTCRGSTGAFKEMWL